MKKVPSMRDIVKQFVCEWVNYGGIAMRRFEVEREMRAQGHAPRAIDFFAFGTPAISEEEASTLIPLHEAQHLGLVTYKGEQS